MPVDKTEERMWQLADELARSGEHRNYQTIELELRARGYSRARSLLDSDSVRERLNSVCDHARKGRAVA